jgi:hypothetical protein
VLKCKFRLVMVFSEVDSPIANLVQQGTNLRPDVTIQHNNAHDDPEAALAETLQVRNLDSKALRCVAIGSF